jgi:hypothetical protein
MSTEGKKKNPLNRDQALNDATSGQFGEEPRPGLTPDSISDTNESQDIQNLRRKAARKLSRDM